MAEPMNPVAKELWLTALRSGEYPQTSGALHRTDDTIVGRRKAGWCCYGVLCDIAAKAGVRVIRKTDHEVEYFDGARDYLPPSVAEWAGLSRNPIVQGISLATRNDGAHLFSDIAALIEACL